MDKAVYVMREEANEEVALKKAVQAFLGSER